MNLQDNTGYKQGLSAELLAASLLVQEGHRVFIPLTYLCPYDLVLEATGKLWRVQVKRAYFIPQRQRKAGLGDRAHYRAVLLPKKKTRVGSGYTVDSFDILALVCTPTLTYFIPMGKLLGADGRPLRQLVVKLQDDTTRLDSLEANRRWVAYANSCEAAVRECVSHSCA